MNSTLFVNSFSTASSSVSLKNKAVISRTCGFPVKWHSKMRSVNLRKEIACSAVGNGELTGSADFLKNKKEASVEIGSNSERTSVVVPTSKKKTQRVPLRVGTGSGDWWMMTAGNKNVVHVRSKEEFDKVLAVAAQNPLEPVPVVVDFFAPWCHACRGFFTQLMKIVAEEQQVLFVMVNYDENKGWVKELGVQQLPYVQFYNGSSKPMHGMTCSRAPPRIKELKRIVALNKLPRCTFSPDQRIPSGEHDLVRLHPVKFMWRNPDENVLITGEPFGSWNSFVPMDPTEDGMHAYQTMLPAGTYQFKFIVNGTWMTTRMYPKVEDSVGEEEIKNNVITVREADWPFVWRKTQDIMMGSTTTTTAATTATSAATTSLHSTTPSSPLVVQQTAAATEAKQKRTADTIGLNSAQLAAVVKEIVQEETRYMQDELADIKSMLAKVNDMIEDAITED